MIGTVRCISNKHNNGNFTKGKEYKVSLGFMTCDFVKINISKQPAERKFEFAFCEFVFV